MAQAWLSQLRLISWLRPPQHGVLPVLFWPCIRLQCSDGARAKPFKATVLRRQMSPALIPFRGTKSGRKRLQPHPLILQAPFGTYTLAVWSRPWTRMLSAIVRVSVLALNRSTPSVLMTWLPQVALTPCLLAVARKNVAVLCLLARLAPDLEQSSPKLTRWPLSGRHRHPADYAALTALWPVRKCPRVP